MSAKELKGIKYDASSANMLEVLETAKHLLNCKFCKNTGVYEVVSPGLFGEFNHDYYLCEEHKNNVS